MRKLLALLLTTVLIILVLGTFVAAQQWLHYEHPAINYSTTFYTNSVAGYPEGTGSDDISYTYTNATCSAPSAQLGATAQRYGLFGVWVSLNTTYVGTANTGSTVYGEGDNTSYSGYRYKLTAYNNTLNGQLYPINIPNTKFVINYYDYPD